MTIAVGLVAGALGKLIMPGKDPGGCLITILLGIGGAIVGKFIAGLLGFSAEGAGRSFSIPSLAISVLGVVVILLIYRLILKRKGR